MTSPYPAAATASPEQYLALIFNNATNMMALFRVDSEGQLRLVSLNQAYLNVVRSAGYPLSEADLIGRSLAGILSEVFRFDASDVATTLGRYQRAVASRQPISYDEEHETPNGRYYGETTLSSVPGSDGACAFVLFSSNDVTERRRAAPTLVEERHKNEETRGQLETKLQQAQKLQAIGTLAGGIAHDFNNILTAILGNAELLQFELPENSRHVLYAREIIEASRRARDLIKQILVFSRQQTQERTERQLTPIITAVLRLLHASLPRNIVIETLLLEYEPTVLADATQMHQVLMNLCMNAAHAMRSNGGKLTVKESVLTPDESFLRAHPQLSPGAHLCLSVADTGHGMDQATLQRIYEPFFTTKGPSEGTGLGLSVVHGIVGTHEGAITVDSAPGLGTTFSIYLPIRTPAAAAARAEAPASKPPVRSGQHILFIDDEEAVRRVGQPILEKFGYRVSLFAEGNSALEFLRSNIADVDAVVSDFSMPGMNGVELARAMREVRPRLPFIVMTGYADTDILQRGEVSGLLSKPFTVDALASAVKIAITEAR